MGVRLRFEVLGPLRCFADAREVPLSTPRERTLLTTLLLRAGEPVPAATLIDAVWGELLPRDARGQLQSSVWRLRKLLEDAGGSRELVATDPIGYRAQVGPEDLDLLRFRRLRDEARAAAAAGDPASANDHYRAALALWRGPALDGFDNSVVRNHAVALDEEYLQALEVCLTLELERGKEDELVPELTRYTRQYPFREKLHGALMLALYRAGRHADALEAYQHARRLLQDQVGIEPSADLQKLHRAVLDRDPKLDPPPLAPVTGGEGATFTPARPRMLPADIPDFVGRTSEVESVRTLLTQPADSAVRVAIIAGSAGVGKTALSVHLAHGLRDAYPDGQLYANLRGYDQAGPMDALNVLGRFLRALGVDGGNLGSTLDERAELYRDLTADRRLLVVLDNAATENQVLPLVPGGQPCGVIINSRAPLDGALGSHVLLRLGPLDEQTAAALVGTIVGADRVAAEPDALTELVQLCGHLPLAVRVAAGKLAAKPHWTIGRLADQLRDERKRLDHLSRGSLDVRASISLSYAGLSADAQYLLRRLCNLDVGSVTSWLPAALLDVTLPHAEQALEELFDAQMIDVVGDDATGLTRYRTHELVRLYARERAEVDEAPDALAAARSRVLGAWLYLADGVYTRLEGVDDYLTMHSNAPRWAVDDDVTVALIEAPQTWFEAERRNLIAAVRWACNTGHNEPCWDLASTISPLFRLRRRFDEWPLILQPALAAARASHNNLAIATILSRLGEASSNRQDFPTAWDYFRRSANLFLQSGHNHGRAAATAHMATIERFTGRHGGASHHYAEALSVLEKTSDRGGEALVLRSIGQLHLDRDDVDQAEAYLTQALVRYRDLRWRRGEAQTKFWLGMLRLNQQRYEEATELFVQVLHHTRTLEDRSGEIQALRGIGLSNIRTGDLDQARKVLTEALRLAAQPRPTLLEGYVRQALKELDAMYLTLGEGQPADYTQLRLKHYGSTQ